jgi:HEAT repeat protein
MINYLIPWLNLIKIFWCEAKIKLGLARPIVLVEFLSSPDWDTRWNAADSLYTYRDQTLIVPVFDALQKETNPHVRKRLTWTLETNKAWDELYSCLDSSKFDVRSNAANALAYSGENRFVAPLLKQMRENDNQDYIYRMILGGIIDASSVGLLLDYLSNATPVMTKGLLELLGKSKGRQVFSRLLLALKDPNAEIREGAVLGLMHLEDTQAIEPLQELLNDPSDDVRRWIKTALRLLNKRL